MTPSLTQKDIIFVGRVRERESLLEIALLLDPPKGGITRKYCSEQQTRVGSAYFWRWFYVLCMNFYKHIWNIYFKHGLLYDLNSCRFKSSMFRDPFLWAKTKTRLIKLFKQKILNKSIISLTNVSVFKIIFFAWLCSSFFFQQKI